MVQFGMVMLIKQMLYGIRTRPVSKIRKYLTVSDVRANTNT